MLCCGNEWDTSNSRWRLSRGAIIGAFASIALAVAVPGAARAATLPLSTTFTCSNGLSGGSGTGCGFDFGTVTVTSPAANELQYAISLTGVDFHTAGLTTFGFDLTGVNATNVSLISFVDGSGTWTFGNAGGYNGDGFSDFGYQMSCSNCGPSNNQISDTTLTFIIADTTDGLGGGNIGFNIVNGTNTGDVSKNIYFEASVFIPGTDCGGSSCTGVIGATVSAVPELSTWGMMLLGFLGLGFAFRHQSRRKVSFA